MKKLKVYVETTIFNRYFEPERDNHKETKFFFEEIEAGKFEAYTSAYVLQELAKASESKRSDMLAMIGRYNISLIGESFEAEALADEYMAHKILSEKHFYDRAHIACASVSGMDMIISLNYAHINRITTKIKTGLINKLYGYGEIYIGSPMEVIDHDE